MNPSCKRWLLMVLLLALVFGSLASMRGADAAAAPSITASGASFEVLTREIERTLQKTHTPGAGVAIVRRDGPAWIAGLGLADVAAHKKVTPDTLFRIGSVSKGFVALSVLKLQEEGKLSLNDTLKSRAPDLAFENPWEQTDPVRLVHLLEHTSGWDDLNLRSYASDPPQELTLREGLALGAIALHSRWKPGTRFSYSNAGPAAAACVIERVTGQRFEDYVEQNWFRPLGMMTASYFGTPEVLARSATLYQGDAAFTPFPYWKISTRPSGAINASTREMASYVGFYLNRGAFGGRQLLPAAAIGRMERATTTYATREGLPTGYGLGNYTTVDGGWVYHGHNGGVLGGLTELAYLPDAGVGYVVMINSSRGGALSEIATLLRRHILKGLPPPAPPPLATVPPDLARRYAGWYETINPRFQLFDFATRFFGFSEIRFHQNSLVWSPLGRNSTTFLAVTDRLFRRHADPVPTLALVADRSEGTLVQTSTFGGGFTLRRVPGWLVALQLAICAFAALAMLVTVVFAFVWVPRKLFGRLRGVTHLSVRALPLFATLAIAAFGAAFAFRPGAEFFSRFGQVTPWSLTVFLSTLAFPLLAVAGLVQAWRHRHAPIRRLVWWQAFLTSLLLTIVAIYLGYWGAIGLRTWA